MNYRMIGKILSLAAFMEALLMIPSVLIAIYYGESIRGFVAAIIGMLIFGSILLAFKPKSTNIHAREGFVVVSLCWIVFSLFGAIPFRVEGVFTDYVSALFETVSGFTTTGASAMTVIEGTPYGLLFWRSFTHWIGGMGVLVFMMAVLPMADNRNMHIMRAEVPGPVVGKLVPKAKNTATILYGIYIALTVLEIMILLICGMPLFDSVVHAFGTAGTGGFGIKNNSIAYYNSASIDVVISVFMLLFSINFNLYFFLLLKNVRAIFKNEELRWFLCIVGAAVVIIAVDISNMYASFGESLRYSLFQVAAIVSTTGYATADFNLWPEFSKALLVALMLTGACAGSTGGGIKLSRMMMLIKSSVCEIKHMLHPRSINLTKMDGKSVSSEVLHNTYIFFILYIFIAIASVLLVSIFDGFDFTTNVTAIISCLSNIGPGLNVVGPTGNFAGFSAASKLVFILDMLLGRLEIFPIIVMFAPDTWKRV